MKKFLIIPGILILALFSCESLSFKEKVVETPIASVGDKHLYTEDLAGILGTDYSVDDSAKIISNYIDKWIKRQMILLKAELNLSEEDKNVSRQLEDYKTSLLIYKYEQLYIKQKLDTSITRTEVEEYYNENLSNFILNKPIVKAVFIKVPGISPNIDNLRKWYRSDDPEDLNLLEDYCYQYANKYDYFDDEWVYFDNILKQIPLDVEDKSRFLRYNSSIETQDSLFHYLVHIRDYKIVGDESPIEFIEENIRSIILNKRKIRLVNELENNIYSDPTLKNKVVKH